MLLTDVTVEVRDESLTRLGVIPDTELNLEATVAFNAVSAWKLTLRRESPLADELLKPGAGIVVTAGDETFTSGPVISNEVVSGTDDAGGTILFTGVTDTIVLTDMLAFPQPANPDPATQTALADVRTGAAETVLHAYVNANIGPSAPSPRRRDLLLMGANGGRGATVTHSAKFESLFDTLALIATANGIGFRVIQRDNRLVFETFVIADVSAEVRLSTSNGSLASNKSNVSAPNVTRAIAAGVGSGTARLVSAFDTPASLEAESKWGRRIERYIDGQQGTAAEIAVTATELLAADGFTAIATQSTPADHVSMGFGTAWHVGDIVAVEVEGQEIPSIVSGAILKADADGIRLGVVIGDPVGFDPEARIAVAGKKLAIRLAAQGVGLDVANVTASTATADATAAAAADLAAAEARIDADIAALPPGINGIRQPTMPAGTHPAGSIWWDSDDGNKVHVYVTGTGWVSARDAGIAQAAADIVTANAAIVTAQATGQQGITDAAQGIITASNDATTKANTAQTAAVAAAAADATAKTEAAEARAATEASNLADAAADAARIAAEAAAALYADSVASGESGQALADAKLYAEQKATEARIAAEAAAALDATEKAEQAEADATAAAAITAQAKANAAQAAAVSAASADATAKANAAESNAITQALIAAQAEVADIYPILGTDIGIGEISTPNLAANSITVEKMVVGSFDNLLSDPTFLAPLGTFWLNGTGVSINATGARSGGPALRIVTAANTASPNVRNLPLESIGVEEGAAYRFAVWVKTAAILPANTLRLGVRFTTLSGNVVLFTQYPAATVAGVWTSASVIFTAPVGALKMGPYLLTIAHPGTTDALFDFTSVTRAANASLIVDGAMTAKIVAGDILRAGTPGGARVDILAGGVIGYDAGGVAKTTISATTGLITATGVTVTGAINASSGTITGILDMNGTGVIRTAASGNRTQMSTSGFFGFNAAGSQTFGVLSSNGILSATGAVFTSMEAVSGTITGILDMGGSGVLRSGSNAGGPSGDRHGIVISETAIIGYDAAGVAKTTLNALTGNFTATDVNLSGMFSAINAGGSGIVLDPTPSGGGKIIFKRNNAEIGAMEAGALGVEIYASSYGFLTIDTDNTWLNNTSSLYVDAPIVYLGGGGLTDSVRSATIMNTTVGNAANMYISSVNGIIYRSTSSARYKQDIEPLPLPVDAILAAEPVRFHDRGEVKRHASGETWKKKIPVLTPSGKQSVKGGRPVTEKIDVPYPEPRWIPGFIAEQLHDAGLGIFVQYDEQGRPDAISDSRLLAAAIPLLRDHNDRLATIEDVVALLIEHKTEVLARINAHDTDIADLTARLTTLEKVPA